MEEILRYLAAYYERLPQPWWALLLAYESLLSGAWLLERALLRRIRSTRGDPTGSAGREQRFRVAALFYFVLLQLPLQRAGRWRSLFPRDWTTAGVGMSISLLGLVLRLWSIRSLAQNFSYVVHVDEKQTLVTRGPYRWVRHPAYLGLLLLLGGLPVLLCDSTLLLLVLAVVVPIIVRRVRREEAWLAERFGEEYEAWRRRSRLLLPGIW